MVFTIVSVEFDVARLVKLHLRLARDVLAVDAAKEPSGKDFSVTGRFLLSTTTMPQAVWWPDVEIKVAKVAQKVAQKEAQKSVF